MTTWLLIAFEIAGMLSSAFASCNVSGGFWDRALPLGLALVFAINFGRDAESLTKGG